MELSSAEKMLQIIEGDTYPNQFEFMREMLGIPQKRTVYLIQDSYLLKAVEYLGGFKNRRIGDTCRMYFTRKLLHRDPNSNKINNMTTETFLWEGILGERHDGLNFDMGEKFEFIEETGSFSPRLVLTEKRLSFQRTA